MVARFVARAALALGLTQLAGCSTERVAEPARVRQAATLAATWREVPLLIRRQMPAMATLGSKVVLFGGLGNGTHADTWEWDGSSWTRKTPAASPPRRSGAMMATLGN